VLLRHPQLPVFLACLLGFFLIFTLPRGTSAADLEVSIHGPGQQKVNAFLAPPSSLAGTNGTQPPALARELFSALERNFGFLPFVHSVPAEEILGKERVGGVKAEAIDFKRFVMGKVDYLFTFGFKRRDSGRVQMELRAFRTRSADLFVGRGFVVTSSKQSRIAANRFCADFMEELTGASGFFRSRLAFVRNREESREICTATPQGDSLNTVIRGREHILSPAWSWDGERIAYVQVARDGHELKIWNRGNGEIRTITLSGNTIISPSYQPNGDLAVSADPKGNPNIYLLNGERLGRTLASSWAIDISPRFDSSGRWMSFVSSRLGNPHIFLKDLKKGKVHRISYEGDYNTSGAISPSGQYVAYSRLTDKGHRIFIHDRLRDTTRQLTHGPGNDEDPAWGPDGYFLAFASNRSGRYRVYVGSRHGGEVKEVETGPGEAKGPDWSPELR